MSVENISVLGEKLADFIKFTLSVCNYQTTLFMMM